MITSMFTPLSASRVNSRQVSGPVSRPNTVTMATLSSQATPRTGRRTPLSKLRAVPRSSGKKVERTSTFTRFSRASSTARLWSTWAPSAAISSISS